MLSTQTRPGEAMMRHSRVRSVVRNKTSARTGSPVRLCSDNPAEVRLTQSASERAEQGRIRQVEHFGAELQVFTLGHRYSLLKREIEVRDSRVSHRALSGIAEGVGGLPDICPDGRAGYHGPGCIAQYSGDAGARALRA
jgi:hypothetical protein